MAYACTLLLTFPALMAVCSHILKLSLVHAHTHTRTRTHAQIRMHTHTRTHACTRVHFKNGISEQYWQRTAHGSYV